MKVFQPFLRRQLQTCSRIDIVWDIYLENSLKSSARNKRGQGTRHRVLPDIKIPGNWHSFLRVNENKEELFKFLAIESTSFQTDKTIVSTHGDQVVSNIDSSSLELCNQEEADTRKFLHANHARLAGCNKIMIRTVDTGVAAIGRNLIYEMITIVLVYLITSCTGWEQALYDF